MAGFIGPNRPFGCVPNGTAPKMRWALRALRIPRTVVPLRLSRNVALRSERKRRLSLFLQKAVATVTEILSCTFMIVRRLRLFYEPIKNSG